MNTDLKNKLAIVTAGSKGIGFGIVESLLKSNAYVSFCSRSQSNVEYACSKLEKFKDKLFFCVGDIADQNFLNRFVDQTKKHFGKNIEILINNNGGPPVGKTLEFSDEQWKKALDVNFYSALRMSRLVFNDMKKEKWGRIINLTSLTAKEPEVGMILSNVTRAAISSFSKTLSKEIGEYGITVNTILTGGVLTERSRDLINLEIKETGESYEEAISRIVSTIPIKKIATPEEFSKFIIFLASEESFYLNGTSIALDGGISISIF